MMIVIFVEWVFLLVTILDNFYLNKISDNIKTVVKLFLD